MKKFTLKLLQMFLVIAIIVVASNPAKADKYYAFIKTTCDKDAQVVTISSVGSPDKDPEDTVDDIRDGKIKDLYFLDDISKNDQKISCDLGENKVVSFMGRKSEDHPGRDDSISVFFNQEKVPGWFSVLKAVKIKISVTSPQDYRVDDCWIKNEPPQFNQRVCQSRHVTDGKLIEESKPTPSKE